MSHAEPEIAVCPACGHHEPVGVLRSLNGAQMPVQVARLLDGSFGGVFCSGCGVTFHHEHRFLYANNAQRLWVVVQPPAEQPSFALHERGVEELFEARFAEAPPAVRVMLRGVRARLCYGSRFLAEAIRVVEMGMDPSLLECAKLLVFRRQLPALFPHLPCELCFTGFVDGAPRFAILDGARGEPVKATAAEGSSEPASEAFIDGPGNLIAEVTAQLPWFEEQHPHLFRRPYVSATRVLFGALPRALPPDANRPPGG